MTSPSACVEAAGHRLRRLSLLCTTSVLATLTFWAADAYAAPVVYEVSINGVPTGQIEEFDDRNGDLYALPDALNRLGLPVPANGSANAARLADIPGLTAKADTRRQTVDLRVAPSLLQSRAHAFTADSKVPRPSADWGAVFNYQFYADSTWSRDIARTDTFSAFFNPRLFSPYGVLNASFIATASHEFKDSAWRRLETTWSWGDWDNLVRYRVGDLVSSGVSWSRPVYMGGVQALTDFAMRPDLLLTPVPLISGVANAPSTVDILVNGVRQSSQTVDQGPFTITNMPVITGRGDVSVVVRDALGRESVQTFPYYVAASMLREDLYAFGVEAGFVRKGYTGNDIDYGDPAASATFRYGVTNWLTAEAHVEGAEKLVNGGIGAVASLGSIGQLNLAATVSHDKKEGTGAQVYAAFERNLWSRSSNFFASAQVATSNYSDLATLVGADPIKRQIRAGVSFSPFDMGESVGLAVTEVKTSKDRFRLVSASVGMPIREGVTAALSGYKSLDPQRWSAMLTLTVQFGPRTTGFFSAGADNGRDGTLTADVFSYPSQDSNGLGWRVGGGIDTLSNERAVGELTWQTPYATLQGGAARNNDINSVRFNVSGAVALLNGVHFARDVYDGFAVVDAGAPGVEVLRANVPVGRTGSDGTLMVRNLVSYNSNKLALNPDTLPLDGEYDRLERVVSPMDRSGMIVKFPQRAPGSSILARIVLPDGSLAPLGAVLVAQEGGEAIGVGYDGLAWFKNVTGNASYTLQSSKTSCAVAVAPIEHEPPMTRDLACR